MKSNSVEIRDKIENELKDLPEDFIITLVTSTENYSSVNIAIPYYLINKRGMNGLYVTMNKPYESLANILKNNNVDTKKLFFIDAISGVIRKKERENENCLILQNPSALMELSIGISKACESKKLKFVIIDSLSTMLVYNKENSTVKFIHYLSAQLRKYKLAGIILSLEEDIEKKILDSVVQFCDKVIKM